MTSPEEKIQPPPFFGPFAGGFVLTIPGIVRFVFRNGVSWFWFLTRTGGHIPSTEFQRRIDW